MAGRFRIQDEIRVPVIPDHFLCPVSLDPMVWMMVISCGHTFAYGSIARWLGSGNAAPRCPTCRRHVDFITTRSGRRHGVRVSTNWSLVAARDDWWRGVLIDAAVPFEPEVAFLMH